jgi:hypothetical protein
MSDLSVKPAPSAPPSAAPPQTPDTKHQTRRGKNPLVRVLEVLASLRLTVLLFALSLLLVFFGTLAQVDAGIWTVVKQYFRGFYVWIPLQLIVQFGRVFFPVIFSRTMTLPGSFPFPGGWTLGFLLLINLLAAHAVRFKLSWKRAGVLVLHFGLILMLVGEFITGVWAIEGNMVIEEGQTSNSVLHQRYTELAVSHPAGKDSDTVTVVPGRMLRSREKGAAISHPDLPFEVTVLKWMVNSSLREAGKRDDNQATKGDGKQVVAVEQPEVSGVSTEQHIDMPSVYARLTDKEGNDLGTWLFSLHPSLKEQPIEVGGKTYYVGLQFKQTYKPYSLELLEFRFDRYPGTDIARNFSSRVRLRDPEYGEDREVVIRMNEPLRHRGDAIFQADWNKATEKGTVLQVVRNPAWQLPYWSCGIVALGMIFHFGLNLTSFLRRRTG